MTEKRFMIESIMMRECIIDNTAEEQLDAFDYIKRLCEISNELAEENKLLKSNIDIKDKTLIELKQENEQLKQELYQQEVSEQQRKEYDEFWKEKINKGIMK